MALIKSKFIGNNEVGEDDIRLSNNAFQRGRNNANDGDINMFKVNASDAVEFGAILNMGGFAISNVGNVDGVDVSAHAARHITGGADEIDGDKLDIDFTPTNYTPSTAPAEADNLDNLTAHLSGIDTALAAGSGDELVKVSANDTTAKYLEDAIVVSDGANSTNALETSTLNDAGDEDFQIQFDQSKVDHGSLLGSSLSDDDHTQYILVAGTRAFTGDQSMGSNKITSLAAGSAAGDAVNFSQLSAAFNDLDRKNSVLLSEIVNLSLTGEQTIDGTLTSATRVLLTGQTDKSENGIYVTAAGAWARSADSDEASEVTLGMMTTVDSGTLRKGTVWLLSTVNATPTVIDTTELTFTELAHEVTTAAGFLDRTNDEFTLKNLADGTFIVGNGSGVATAVTMSGDVTFTNAGVAAIGNTKVTNAMLAGSITDAKLDSDYVQTSEVDGATIKFAASALSGLVPTKNDDTLDGTDITNQYVDFSNVATASSISLSVDGVTQVEGTDYTVSLTGGAGGNTRITFAGDLATGGEAELVSGDIMHFQYGVL